MKKITVFFAGAIMLAGLILVSTAFKPLTERASANGQGALDLGLANIQHFSFHANTDNNGNVSGSFEVKSPGQELRLHGTITCLRILGDNKTAFMSGQVTHRTGDGFPGLYNIGDVVFFEVQDNGEGSNALTDKFSDLRTNGNTTPVCGQYSIGMFNIANGNIQVKP